MIEPSNPDNPHRFRTGDPLADSQTSGGVVELISNIQATRANLDQLAKSMYSITDALRVQAKIQHETTSLTKEKVLLERQWANLQGEIAEQQERYLMKEGQLLQHKAKGLGLLREEAAESLKLFNNKTKWNALEAKEREAHFERISALAQKVSTHQVLSGKGISPGVAESMGVGSDITRAMTPKGLGRLGAWVGGKAKGALTKITDLDSQELANFDLTSPGSYMRAWKGMSPLLRSGVLMPLTASLGAAHGFNVPGTGIRVPGFHDFNDIGKLTGEGAGAGAAGWWKGFKTGINPWDAISGQMAQEIIKGVRGKGFRGEIANAMTESIVDVIKDVGVEAGQATEIFTTALRDGTDSLKGITTALTNLDDIARRTGQSVPELTQAFQSFQERGRTRGGPTGQQINKVQEAFGSYFPGIDPNLVATIYDGIMSSPFAMQMGILPGMEYGPTAMSNFGGVFDAMIEQVRPMLDSLPGATLDDKIGFLQSPENGLSSIFPGLAEVPTDMLKRMLEGKVSFSSLTEAGGSADIEKKVDDELARLKEEMEQIPPDNPLTPLESPEMQKQREADSARRQKLQDRIDKLEQDALLIDFNKATDPSSEDAVKILESMGADDWAIEIMKKQNTAANVRNTFAAITGQGEAAGLSMTELNNAIKVQSGEVMITVGIDPKSGRLSLSGAINQQANAERATSPSGGRRPNNSGPNPRYIPGHSPGLNN